MVWRENGGKRRRSFATEDEARAFANNFLATVGRGTIDISALLPAMLDRHGPSRTVIEFARPLTEDPDLGAASRDIHRNALRKIDGTLLGERALNRVTLMSRPFSMADIPWSSAGQTAGLSGARRLPPHRRAPPRPPRVGRSG